MKIAYKSIAVAVAAAFSCGTALAHTPAGTQAYRRDQMQLQADKAALKREENQLRADLRTLSADTKEGKMAAMSKDAERVYQDREAIYGEKTMEIPGDEPGSLQMQSDEAALKREQARLNADIHRLKADTKEGRMAAMSPDAEKAYQDRQAVKGEKMDIAHDLAQLKADQKS